MSGFVATVIRTRDLAATLRCSSDAVQRMARRDRLFRAARWRRGWWKVKPLIAAGVIDLPKG